MSVITTIYNVLETDGRLRALLADSVINPTKKAIYEEWADETAAFPYMNLSFSFTVSDDHFAKNETSFTIDIFTESDSLRAEDIKNACIMALDHRTFDDPEDGAHIRVYYNRDAIITEQTPKITHWLVEFSLHHWRNTFIAAHITE